MEQNCRNLNLSYITHTQTLSSLDNSTNIDKDTIPNYEWICMQYYLVVEIIGGSICLGIGFVGNGLTMFTLWPERKTNTTTFLLITLAVFNNIELVFRYSTIVVTHLCDYASMYSQSICEFHDRWARPYIWLYVFPIGLIFQLAGTWNIVLVTFCRYVDACHPLKVKHLTSMFKIRITLLSITVSSIVFYIPRAVAGWVDYNEDGSAYTTYYREYTTYLAYNIGYFVIIHFVIIYLIPFASLIYMTTILIKKLRLRKKQHEQMTRKMRKEDGIHWVLITVVITFMLCHLLSPSMRILIRFLPDGFLNDCRYFFKYYSAVGSLGLLVNASSNFIIYCNLGNFGLKFRRQLKMRVRIGTTVEPSSDSSVKNTGLSNVDQHVGDAGQLRCSADHQMSNFSQHMSNVNPHVHDPSQNVCGTGHYVSNIGQHVSNIGQHVSNIGQYLRKSHLHVSDVTQHDLVESVGDISQHVCTSQQHVTSI